MFERNPDTIETNGSREWDQQNGYVHSLMNTKDKRGFLVLRSQHFVSKAS